MLPILYTFRRCPYAMRARMAIKYSGQQVYRREVVLREMPQQLLDISSKATVPVLQLTDKTVIDESLDIMYWALERHDPDGWIQPEKSAEAKQLITKNDQDFKCCLDRYKYADRHPENTAQFYRQECSSFLEALEIRLSRNSYLLGSNISIADIAIFPFIRQFAFVDKEWFDATSYEALKGWLRKLLLSELFESVMRKSPPWHEGDEPVRL